MRSFLSILLLCHFSLVGSLLAAGSSTFSDGSYLMVDTTPLQSFTWLLGDWSRTSNNRTYGETWTQVSETTFEGYGFMVRAAIGDTLVTEHLLLVAMGDDIFYIPKVSENIYPVPFRLVSAESDKWTFENPQHDYPQRIEYERTAEDELKVSISDMSRTQVIPFLFRKEW